MQCEVTFQAQRGCEIKRFQTHALDPHWEVREGAEAPASSFRTQTLCGPLAPAGRLSLAVSPHENPRPLLQPATRPWPCKASPRVASMPHILPLPQPNHSSQATHGNHRHLWLGVGCDSRSPGVTELPPALLSPLPEDRVSCSFWGTATRDSGRMCIHPTTARPLLPQGLRRRS